MALQFIISLMNAQCLTNLFERLQSEPAKEYAAATLHKAWLSDNMKSDLYLGRIRTFRVCRAYDDPSVIYLPTPRGAIRLQRQRAKYGELPRIEVMIYDSNFTEWVGKCLGVGSVKRSQISNIYDLRHIYLRSILSLKPATPMDGDETSIISTLSGGKLEYRIADNLATLNLLDANLDSDITDAGDERLDGHFKFESILAVTA